MQIFYICGSVHHNSRLKKSNKMHLYADIYLLLNYSTCFGHPSHPSSGVHKTVVGSLWYRSYYLGSKLLKSDQIGTKFEDHFCLFGVDKFYICGSMHRNSRLKKSNKMQLYTDVYLLLNYLFRASIAPIIRSPYLVMFEEACFPDSMICTRCCNCSFMYSWWWVWWTSETCRVI